MQLQVTYQFIRSIGEETLQTAKESITISLFHFRNEPGYMKPCLSFINICIKGSKYLINPSSTSRLGNPRW